MNEEKLAENGSSLHKDFRLLDDAREGRNLVVRDDQHEFSWLLDAAGAARRREGRFSLFDSGKLSVSELEWLAEAGADIYTSDDTRPRLDELDLVVGAAARGNAVTAFFHRGRLGAEEGDTGFSFESLKEAARKGIYLHVTNREKERDFFLLSELAHECLRKSTRLVYYHHGRPEASLKSVAAEGAWIHLSDRNLDKDEDGLLLIDIHEASNKSGTRLVLHVEKGLPFLLLRGLQEAGAFLLFRTPPSDYRSPFRKIEEKARRRKLDFRAYYLRATFLP